MGALHFTRRSTQRKNSMLSMDQMHLLNRMQIIPVHIHWLLIMKATKIVL